jgi:Cu(I)/Ag(I) efflux system protein CusF
MASRFFRLSMLGLTPIALAACAEPGPAVTQAPSAPPAVGLDLGSSSRAPRFAGLGGDVEGFGRTERGAAPVASGATRGMGHGSTGDMPIGHGSMAGMTHGSMADKQMMPGMSHAPMGGAPMAHGSGTPSSGANQQVADAGHGHAQGSGTVNSVDAATHKVNVTHDPIPAIGWPSMTMDFAVAPSVDLRAVTPGTRVNFQMEQSQGGMYVIQTITPAAGGRR